jgi:membrane fusion protein, heavy metal efflux system
MISCFLKRLRSRGPAQAVIAVAGAVAVIAGGAVLNSAFMANADSDHRAASQLQASAAAPDRNSFDVTESQWEDLGVDPVVTRTFVSRLTTDGKIAIDENRATPIFSPYAGRVMKLFAQPGEEVNQGQALFTIEAPDMVQAQNDFIAASSALNKAESQLRLATTVEKRQNDLYAAKAVPLKDWQQAQADLITAESDRRSATVAFEAARNRLRILGRTDLEIETFRTTGRISPETPVHTPISGTVVQRKVGPGQYVSVGSSDPVFMIGDLSTVWLVANVRESDAAKVHTGQVVEFKVMAHPQRVFHGTVSYVAAALDPATRRLAVRATIDNSDNALKPEMFANVTIAFSDTVSSVAVPRQALIYEGDTARVWVASADRRLELRSVRCGQLNGNLVQILNGLRPGEKVVTRGNLFIDRAAKTRQS